MTLASFGANHSFSWLRYISQLQSCLVPDIALLTFITIIARYHGERPLVLFPGFQSQFTSRCCGWPTLVRLPPLFLLQFMGNFYIFESTRDMVLRTPNLQDLHIRLTFPSYALPISCFSTAHLRVPPSSSRNILRQNLIPRFAFHDCKSLVSMLLNEWIVSNWRDVLVSAFLNIFMINTFWDIWYRSLFSEIQFLIT